MSTIPTASVPVNPTPNTHPPSGIEHADPAHAGEAVESFSGSWRGRVGKGTGIVSALAVVAGTAYWIIKDNIHRASPPPPAVHAKLTKNDAPVYAGYEFHVKHGRNYAFDSHGETEDLSQDAGRDWELFFRDPATPNTPTPPVASGVVPNSGELKIPLR